MYWVTGFWNCYFSFLFKVIHFSAYWCFSCILLNILFVCSACGGQKRASYPLELELKTQPLESLGNLTQVLYKSNKCAFNCWAVSLTPVSFCKLYYYSNKNRLDFFYQDFYILKVTLVCAYGTNGYAYLMAVNKIRG